MSAASVVNRSITRHTVLNVRSTARRTASSISRSGFTRAARATASTTRVTAVSGTQDNAVISTNWLRVSAGSEATALPTNSAPTISSRAARRSRTDIPEALGTISPSIEPSIKHAGLAAGQFFELSEILRKRLGNAFRVQDIDPMRSQAQHREAHGHAMVVIRFDTTRARCAGM